jgi:hypothetical protein
VKVDRSVLAVTPITENGIGAGGGRTELTVVSDDLVTVPAALVALIVYTVDIVGDTILVPAISTGPIPWSIFTKLAPVTFHNRVDVPPELIADGLLLNSLITEGCGIGGMIFDTGGKTVIQPIIRINTSSDRKRKTNLFKLVTSKNI